MFDLHTHTFNSDGELCPSELVRRYEAAGYAGVALTDHVDCSNIGSVVPALVDFSRQVSQFMGIDVLPGCELTHVPPAQIKDMVLRARDLGARFVIMHGETIVEPVAQGTNRAAIMAGVDIIAHPGLITEEDVRMAAEKSVCLEITSRGGHSYTNGHVVSLARECDATMVYSSDCHSPSNILSSEMVMAVLAGAGLSPDEVDEVLSNTAREFQKKKGLV